MSAFVRRQFPDIAPAAWEHPADAAALRALRAVPGFDRVVALTMGRLNERAVGRRLIDGSEPATAARHPRLADLWAQVVLTLDAPDPVPLRVKKMGGINALTAGVDQPLIVVSAEAVGLLEDDQLRVILAHELAHILSGHVLYKMMLGVLLQAGWLSLALPTSLPVVAGVALAMLEWDRKSELSADRASALALGGSAPVAATLRRAGDERGILWGKAQQLPEEWREVGGRVALGAERVLSRHPPVGDRITALEAWVGSAEWESLQRGDYPRRGDQPRPGTWDALRDTADGLKTGLQEALGPLAARLKRP